MKIAWKQRKGMVLPSVFAVLVLLMMVAFTITQIGISSLGNAQSYGQDDQALYAADTGLVRALAQYQMTGKLDGGMQGEVPSTGAKYEVTLTSNIGTDDMPVPGGAMIPPGTAYLLSEGRTNRGRVVRRSAALCQTGVGSVQVGALARELTAINSSLAAYDSAKEASGYDGEGPDAGALMPNEVVLATNEKEGKPIKLTDAKVQGTIFVGPGGNPKDLIEQNGATELRRQETLLKEIEVPAIEIPTLPGEEGDEEELKTAQPSYAPYGQGSEAFSISRNANGEVSASNQCFSMTVYPDGRFTAVETGPPVYRASGNVRTGEFSSPAGQAFPNMKISQTEFVLEGGYHGMKLTRTGQLTVDKPSNDSSDLWRAGPSAQQQFSAPSWLSQSFFGNPAEDLVNPDEIDTGYYGKIDINNAKKTNLKDGATIVARDLLIGAGGTLTLPDGAKNVTIYVTGKLEVSGDNAILNSTRSAKNLKVYYTGKEKVKLSGGSNSFLTLIAPDADITLDGAGSTFYGALIGQHVSILNAAFYFDVATEGIGTGNGGTTLKVLSHFRI